MKMIVLATNSEGGPEFHTCLLDVAQHQIDAGEHYELAKENAEYNGYEHPMIAFDHLDPAAQQFGDILVWL